MKQLIILSIEIDVSGLSKQNTNVIMQKFMSTLKDSFNDDEINENYIIKQIFLPSNKTRIKCIYPKNGQTEVNVDIEEQMKKVETEILKYKNPKLWDEWNILMRWAKLKNIKKIKYEIGM